MGLPKKSWADCTNDFRKMEVTSETVRVRSAGVGSDLGVGTWEAAGVPTLLEGGKGEGAG